MVLEWKIFRALRFYHFDLKTFLCKGTFYDEYQIFSNIKELIRCFKDVALRKVRVLKICFLKICYVGGWGV